MSHDHLNHCTNFKAQRYASVKPRLFVYVMAGFSFLLSTFYSCRKPATISEDERRLEVYQTLHQYAWERNDSAIIPYLKAKKAYDRALAAELLGSVMSKTALPFLSQSVQSDQDKEVRRMAAFALGQLRDSAAVPPMLIAVRSETSGLVRTELFRALGRCANNDVWNMLLGFRPDTEELKTSWMDCLFQASMTPNGYLAASDTLLRKSVELSVGDSLYPVYWAHYIKRLRNHWDKGQFDYIRTAVNEMTDDPALLYHIGVATGDSTLRVTKDPVSGSPYDLSDLSGDWKQESHPFRRNFLIEEALRGIEDSFQLRPLVWELLRASDMAAISLGCYQIVENPTYFNDSTTRNLLLKNRSWANRTSKLETHLDIRKALDALGLESTDPDELQYAPLDWTYWKELDSTEKVVIKTDAGEIQCELYPWKAPATVVRFLKSVDSSDYAGRYFHRVVPHFVIQGGCPRGDGWGSESWMLRSYFTPEFTYTPGSIGLASVGPDTEGVQFFITHEHTPHLDGRYSIFGRVVSGMTVVRKIRPGHRILSIVRL